MLKDFEKYEENIEEENMQKDLHDLPDLECKEKDLPDLESPPDGRPPVEGHQTPPHLVYKVGSFDSPVYPDTPATSISSTAMPSDSPYWQFIGIYLFI